MTYAKILTPFMNTKSAEGSFAAAASLAREFKAHIDVVHMQVQPPASTSAYYPYPYAYIPVDVKEFEEAARVLATELKGTFDAQCRRLNLNVMEESRHAQSEGATASWTEASGDFPARMAARARCADLTVLAHPDGESPIYENTLIEELLFQSGRPLLLARRDFETVPKTIVIGWSGSLEGARAIAGALPLLKRADNVSVVCVGTVSTAIESPEAVVSHLRLHGVRAQSVAKALDKGEDAETVFADFARRQGAELIVMGAYSHSRWREAILGGFTRKMLGQDEFSLLMAH